MATKSPVRDTRYYTTVALDALELLMVNLPSSSRPSIIRAYLVCLEDSILQSIAERSDILEIIRAEAAHVYNGRRAING